jgi:hypothetical protein
VNRYVGDYELIDTESANVVGHYGSEGAALRAVAESVQAYGADAPELLSLALIRLDVPPDHGAIAAGAALIARATGGVSSPTQHP